MKVKVEIEVSSNQFFNHLVQSVIKDCKSATGKDISIKQVIDGYNYTRKITYKKRPVDIKMKIGPQIENKYFQVSYHTSETKGLYYYDFSKEGDQEYVTYYEETSYLEDTIGNKLGEFVKKFKEKSLQNKIMNNIELTQTYIKNHLDD